MGRAGRRRFERLFTAERMVEGTLRSYDELRGLSPAPERLPEAVAVAGSGCLAAGLSP